MNRYIPVFNQFLDKIYLAIGRYFGEVMMFIDDLYSIKFQNDVEAVVELSDENHPVFKAHFPAKPIMPGFIHFEIIGKVFGFEITSIKKAKFLKLVKPKETLIYKRDGNKFGVFSKDESVASFIL